MNVLNSMTVFVEVAKQNGFAPAARALSLSTSAVSRQVIELEQWLGVELFQRSTRKLSLTEEGAQYLDRCQKVIDDVRSIESMASSALEEPTGTLRLTAPVFFAKDCLQHLLPGFLSTYPQVSISLAVVDRFVDLIDEGFDLALRIGELPDSTLVARKLMNVDLVIVASPKYLEVQGTPTQPSDLKKHNCIIDTIATFNNRWPMKLDRKKHPIKVSGNITVNSGEIARSMAIEGLGLTLLPRFFVLKNLKNGQLVSILEDDIKSDAGLYAVYPQGRHKTPKVRCFIDYVIARIEQLQKKYSAT